MARRNESSMTQNKPIAVLVGATGDFGKAISVRLSAEGLRIVAVGRTQESLEALKKDVPGLETCVADISDDSSIDAIKAALDGPVQLAVHGPGLAAPGHVTELAPDALAASVNIKAGGMLRLTRAVDSHLMEGARLVGIAGHYGLEPTDYACAAGVANASLIALMRQLSLAYGPRGISAHTVAPGPADTPRLHRIAEVRARDNGTTPEEVLEHMKADSSLKTLVTPEQVAWAVASLLAPEAIATTGTVLSLDGGRRRGMP